MWLTRRAFSVITCIIMVLVLAGSALAHDPLANMTTDLNSLISVSRTGSEIILDRNATYTLSANLDIANGRVIVIPQGTLIQLGVYDLTFSLPPIADGYQIFDVNSSGRVYISSAGAYIVDPEWWGMDINAAETAINYAIASNTSSVGHKVWLGRDYYKLTSSIIFDKPAVLEGRNWASTIIYPPVNSTINMIQINVSYCVIRNLCLSGYAKSVISGAGIRIGTPSLQPIFTMIDTVELAHLYDGIQLSGGHRITINNSYITYSGRYGLFVNNEAHTDRGAIFISGTMFLHNVSAGIRHELGGGIYIVNCISGWDTIFYDLEPSATLLSSELIISSSDIIGCADKCFKLGSTSATAGSYQGIVLIGNNIGIGATGVLDIYIGDGVREVSITGNHFSYIYDYTHPRIELDEDTSKIEISGNHFVNSSPTIAGEAIKITDTDVSQVNIRGNSYVNIQTVFSNVSSNNIFFDDILNISYSDWSTASYKELFKVDYLTYTGGEIKLTVEGVAQIDATPTYAGYVRTVNSQVVRDAGACSVNSYINQSIGATNLLQLDTATTSGSVRIGVQKYSSHVSIWPSAQLSMSGRIAGVTILP